MIDGYAWGKVIHVISIIAWMAGVFYLPRLFVYHADVPPNSDSAKLFEIMERRLYGVIMTPAMVLSLASGFFLVSITDIWSAGWLHIKLTAVLGLVIYQLLLNYWRKALASGTCVRTSKFFRIINEIPTLLLVIIIICVIIKPF